MVQSFDDQAIEVVNYPKGVRLFRQGEPGDAAFIVNSGSVGIYREVNGERVPLATLGKGELFGEMAVIDGSPRMATAFTLEDCTLTMISVDLMAEKMRKSDPFIKALVTMLLANLRSVHDSYEPKPRSLIDSVNGISRYSEILTNFLSQSYKTELPVDIAMKVGQLNEIVTSLQSMIAEKNGGKERRSSVLPPENPPE